MTLLGATTPACDGDPHAPALDPHLESPRGNGRRFWTLYRFFEAYAFAFGIPKDA